MRCRLIVDEMQTGISEMWRGNIDEMQPGSG
jgi:hypothetical protein